MYGNTDMTMIVATEYQRTRVAEADRFRLLARARRARRGARQPASHEARAGTLASRTPAAA